jgi:hypothetical protein
LITIGLIILAFVLLLRGTGGNSGGQGGPLDITKYGTTSVVAQMTFSNPTQADQTHRQVLVSVGKDSSTINIYQGYQQTVLQTKTYANNVTSYQQFLASLQRAGFTKGDNSKAVASEAGFCPLGDSFVYELVNGDQDIQRYWSTTCGQGNFKGNRSVVQQLFKQQIPDWGNLTANIAF